MQNGDFWPTAGREGLDKDDWKDARQLALIHRPVSPGAVALTAGVAADVAQWEQGVCPRNRGPSGREKLRGAVGAIVCGLLRNWRKGRASHRSRSAKAFDAGALVSHRQFIAAMDGLVGADFADTKGGTRWALDLGDGVSASLGSAARYWPTARLLKAAQRHGVLPGTVDDDYVAVVSTIAPKVPEPIEVRPMKARMERKGEARSATRRLLPLTTLGDNLGRLRADVEAANDYAAQHKVTGCLPPRWRAVFTACAELGGRFYSVGNEGAYQRMPGRARSLITIDGEPVTECDVCASHLTIMHGLLGLPLPEGDLYAIADIGRATVKAWITATLGKGTPVKQWSAKTLRRLPRLAHIDAKMIGEAVCARYPFLQRPAEAVAATAGLNRLADIGKPAALLTHRLQAIEAAAINGAVGYLRGRGTLALPVHDSLIVPRSQAGYVNGALDGAYSVFAKVKPRILFSEDGNIATGGELAAAAD